MIKLIKINQPGKCCKKRSFPQSRKKHNKNLHHLVIHSLFVVFHHQFDEIILPGQAVLAVLWHLVKLFITALFSWRGPKPPKSFQGITCQQGKTTTVLQIVGKCFYLVDRFEKCLLDFLMANFLWHMYGKLLCNLVTFLDKSLKNT